MSRWRTRSCGILAGIAAPLALVACGGQPRQDVAEPSGTFPVQVTRATFPAQQRLAQHAQMQIIVRNAGQKPIPNLAVTITTQQYGTSVKAFATCVGVAPGSASCQSEGSGPGSDLASHSRPVWVIDRPPEPPPTAANGHRTCAYSCQAGGAGGYATAYANTWAAGRLPPGAVVRFVWGVTAVTTGTYNLQYRIAAGLNGKAQAQLAGGGVPQGSFAVKISAKPKQQYVNNAGQIVTGSGAQGGNGR